MWNLTRLCSRKATLVAGMGEAVAEGAGQKVMRSPGGGKRTWSCKEVSEWTRAGPAECKKDTSITLEFKIHMIEKNSTHVWM